LSFPTVSGSPLAIGFITVQRIVIGNQSSKYSASRFQYKYCLLELDFDFLGEGREHGQ
jgi:hypothetical protein